MMRRAGEAGIAGAIRLTRHALERYFDTEDREAPTLSTRCGDHVLVLANSRHSSVRQAIWELSR